MTGGSSRVAVQLLVPAADRLLALAAGAAGSGATVLDPAHVSLGWPWRAVPDLGDVGAVGPPPLRLDALAARPSRRGQRLLLVPLDGHAEELDALARRLGWAGDPVRPHLSLVRGAPDAVERARAAVLPALPVTARATAVQVTVEQAGRWAEVSRSRL